MDASGRALAQGYLSTRDGASVIHSFETVVLKGLAPDGGLFLPADIPASSDWVGLTIKGFLSSVQGIMSMFPISRTGSTCPTPTLPFKF